MDRNEVQARHDELAGNVARAQADLDYWRARHEEPRFAARLQSYKAEVEATKEALVAADKPDLMRTLQAEVRARRRLLETLGLQPLAQAVEETRRELRKFDDDHSLFLAHEAAEVTAARKAAGA